MVSISRSNYDVIIVVSSTQEQANFWKERLESSELISEETLVYSIFEEWDGGAGQLLGTLNAWVEVSKYSNLFEMVEDGSSVAIYHTAGKGTGIHCPPVIAQDKLFIRWKGNLFCFRVITKS